MKRNTILFLSLLLILGGWLLAKEKTIVKVKVQTANVRSAPDATATVIAKVSAGTLLEASGREGAWYKVTVSVQGGTQASGYIHNSVVNVISGEAEEEAEEAEEEDETRTDAAPRSDAPRYRPVTVKEYASGGVKLMAGLSMGNLTISEPLPAEVAKTSKMDFMGGIGFESGGQIAFELDILYSPGGAVIKPTDPAETGKLTMSGTAITLPILLKVRLLRGTTPYLLAGGEVGYALNQKFVLDDGQGNVEEEDISDEINRLYYGLCFGGGLELQAGSMNLLFEARYRLGLSNLIKDPVPGESVKATALSFLLGIKF